MLLALYSPYPHCGKSEVAKYLVNNYKFNEYAFAEPLKAMLRTLLEYLKISDEQIDFYLNNAMGKQSIIDELQCTSRYLMQTLGTEWGRELISPNLWCLISKNYISQMDNVVISDLRFNEELKLITELNGKIIMITRPGYEIDGEVKSESNLNGYKFDYIINNDLTIDKLYDQVDDMVNELGIF